MSSKVNSDLGKIIKTIQSKKKEDENIIYSKLELQNGFEWYILEYDPQTKEAYGFVNLNDPKNAEFGYFNILDLEKLEFNEQIKNLVDNSTREQLFSVKIDHNFEPKPISAVVKDVKSSLSIQDQT